MVTAELAVALPALVTVVAVALGGIAVATAQLRCVDAAAVAARLAARGETVAVLRSAALPAAPSGAALTLHRSGPLVTAQVSATWRIPALGALLPGWPVTGRATFAREDATGAP